MNNLNINDQVHFFNFCMKEFYKKDFNGFKYNREDKCIIFRSFVSFSSELIIYYFIVETSVIHWLEYNGRIS